MAVNYDIDNGIGYNSLPKSINNMASLENSHYYKFPTYVSEYGTSGGSHYKKDDGKNIGRSIITLLTFLFFLHIIQTCIQEQTNNMNYTTPQVVVMQAKSANRAKERLFKKIDNSIIPHQEQDDFGKEKYFVKKK